MRHVALGCALACAGCSSILGIDDLTLADAAPPIDGERCYGTLATRCYDAPPDGDVTLSGAIDTATDARCEALAQPDGPELCLIAGDTITVDATGVVATGARPLMLVAATTITVTGTLDVASRRGTQLGAGANAAACTTLAPGKTARHGGGGAGGSFGSRGQLGGRGGGDGDEIGDGGQPDPLPQTATFVRGGCAGGTGGAGMIELPGAGGDGGGAVYLVAGASIAVGGQLQASGAGGAGPAESSGSSGGGGGGAGGLVALEAPMITIDGSVVANGGGGGEGGGETAAGAPGDNGSVFDAAANGGGGMSEGGDGGEGFALDSAAMVGKQGTPGTGAHGGGGGGGGGAGVVWIKGVLSGTSISPAPTVAQ